MLIQSRILGMGLGTLLLAASLAFFPVQAHAYLYQGWESIAAIDDPGIDHSPGNGGGNGTSANLNILRAYHASDATNYYFRIDVGSLPSSGNFFYGVVIDSAGGSAGYSLFGTEADYLLLRIAAPGFTSSNISVQNNATAGEGFTALEWSVAKESWGTPFDWFSFAYKPTGQGAYDLTEKITVTPIPGAVWLLGSGLGILYGVRRKK